MIVATAGHVDHGKTELIKALTGVDTDRLPEEKQRGLSIDLGFAYQSLPNHTTIGFVDVPGHEKFIRNMLAGVGGIDLGLLVVAADDGVMPQTREHFSILSLLGIRECLVALTKIDRVPAERVQEVEHEVQRLLSESGYRDVPVFAVCAPENRGVEALAEALSERSAALHSRSTDGHFRLAIDRAFSLKGIGLVVTGMVFSGTASVEDQLLLSPAGHPIRIRGIRLHDTNSDHAPAGTRCAINIAGRGVSESSVRRGDWLLHPALHAPTRRVDVEVQVLAAEKQALKHWTPTHLHLGAAHVSARVAVLGSGAIGAGETALAQLVLEQDVCVVRGDRFVIRDQSAQRTLAGGRVIDPFSPKRGRARPERLAALRAMCQPAVSDVLSSLASLEGSGVQLQQFATAHNVTRGQLDKLVDALSLVRVGRNLDERVLGETTWRALLDQVESIVGAFHREQPEAAGPNLRDIELAHRPHIEPIVLGAVVDGLVEAGRLGRRGLQVHLPAHEIKVSERDRQLWDRVAPKLAPSEGSPLSLHQAAEELGVDKRILETSLKHAVKVGRMLQVSKNRYVPADYVGALAQTAERLAKAAELGQFSAAEFRDCIKMGRNFAIDLLEYFDRVGFTERLGNTRRIKRSAATVFAFKTDHS